MGTPRNHSVIKAFRILQAFATHGSALTASEVAGAAGLNAATAHRFLRLRGRGRESENFSR